MSSEPLSISVYDCHCNWCGRDFQTTDVITNTCPDCRSIAHHAYDAALQQIRQERALAEELRAFLKETDDG